MRDVCVEDTGLSSVFWWLSGGVTPVPIPNTEVKLSIADDTRKGKVGSRQNSELKTNRTRQQAGRFVLAAGGL